ncbi:serine/threonine-protein kinase HipA [Pontibacter aydingkolensis]|uniref:HipA N-terminal domain-containing protein n=1 Tax=Pontibacter aydingkolensis TaxID=1911536 RepID=A0ABS7CYK7_9BACT|nr:HipA N-terminal domain-containing protein [Pontibacter aydingkolensis]MBW7468951.1 HipA N-terminal domain-containing protein [Pontibacter aydingkolensis]
MGRKGFVYNNSTLAGILEETPEGYTFTYDKSYYLDVKQPAISLSLPKTAVVHQATVLFPFFNGLLSEGINKQTQCRLLQIDENDAFGLLLKTAHTETIGAITVKEIRE